MSSVLLSSKIKLTVLFPRSFSMESGPSESPACLKRVASPAAKPAVSGEGKNLRQICSLEGRGNCAIQTVNVWNETGFHF